MRAFEYVRATDVGQAVATITAEPATSYLAGGTTQLDLMKDGVLNPDRLIDITRLPLRGITTGASDGQRAIRVGALTTMEELAGDPTLGRALPVVREALLASASVQLRNMGTIGGNLLQRTRCRYFRDPVVPCNKRVPGSGCSALRGYHRGHAVLGTSEHCIATHASDLTVALAALDAVVDIQGRDGARSMPLTEFYRVPGETPQLETALEHGELITAVELPLLPEGAHSTYLKVRDRASYEFALASAAVALLVQDGVIRQARIALGGVATVPWRAIRAEDFLRGAPAETETFRGAAQLAVENAIPRRDNGFKVELAKRAIVRALQSVSVPA